MCVGVHADIKYGYIIRWLFFLLIVYRFECYGLTYIIVIWCQFTDASDIALFVTVVFGLGDSFYGLVYDGVGCLLAIYLVFRWSIKCGCGRGLLCLGLVCRSL